MIMNHYYIAVVLLLWTRPTRSNSECDLTKYQEYLETTGQDMFIVSSMCESAVTLLTTRLAGKHGPVRQEDMEAIMCIQYCEDTDIMHLEAMSISGCTCAQLSSESHIELDFCRQNSARYLCDYLGVCGEWNCKLEDYMCPRHEWDTKYGCSDAVSLQIGATSMVLVTLSLLLLS